MQCDMHNMMKSIVYKKILKLSCGTKQYLETGRTLNYYHCDVGSIGGFLHWLIIFTHIPIELGVGIFYLVR